ncbi:alpha/beta hydrolase-fold protein [Streptomyces sp. NBC_00356]|uniref:alpha/beta hydrolase-fold protein n=1 Tax=Streptomyces sp. NBC_00356 TaxID=2975724 RepID=UPI002E25930F
MVDRRTFIAGTAAVSGLAAAGGLSVSNASAQDAAASQAGHIKGATAITKVYGAGQKLIALAVEYDRDIDNSALSGSAFEVADRTVTKVYANRTPELAEHGRDGRYVMVELSPDDDGALLWSTGGGGGGGTASPSASTSASASPSPSPSGSTGTGAGAGGPKVGDTTPSNATLTPASATVTQTGPVATVHGGVLPTNSTPVTTSSVTNLVVDDFRQFTFHDPATGQTLRYNLFVPKSHRHGSPGRRYPLVLFMHDASLINIDTISPLVQGNGAVCWASPEDQARNEAFVLAPEYGAVVVDDDYEPMALFETTAHLVEEITETYAVDADRRYTTGQSMGAMMSLGLNIAYPDLFAAAYIVAGQWPAEQAAPLARKNLWIAVSQDDAKAYPGENAITDVIAAQGTSVGKAVWDAGATAAQFAADVRNLEKQKAPVNYAAFLTGTVTANSTATNAHMGTWQIAYDIPGIRDWIFRQTRRTGR